MNSQKKTDMPSRLSPFLLAAATVIWGGTFVVMKQSVDVLPTFWLLAIRFTAAGLVLALVFLRRWRYVSRGCVAGGAVMGLFLFLAYVFQTFGVERTTP